MSRNAVTNNDDAPAPVGDRTAGQVNDASQQQLSVPVNQNFNDIVAQNRPREMTQSVHDPLGHDRLSSANSVIAQSGNGNDSAIKDSTPESGTKPAKLTAAEQLKEPVVPGSAARRDSNGEIQHQDRREQRQGRETERREEGQQGQRQNGQQQARENGEREEGQQGQRQNGQRQQNQGRETEERTEEKQQGQRQKNGQRQQQQQGRENGEREEGQQGQRQNGQRQQHQGRENVEREEGQQGQRQNGQRQQNQGRETEERTEEKQQGQRQNGQRQQQQQGRENGEREEGQQGQRQNGQRQQHQGRENGDREEGQQGQRQNGQRQQHQGRENGEREQEGQRQNGQRQQNQRRENDERGEQDQQGGQRRPAQSAQTHPANNGTGETNPVPASRPRETREERGRHSAEPKEKAEPVVPGSATTRSGSPTEAGREVGRDRRPEESGSQAHRGPLGSIVNATRDPQRPENKNDSPAPAPVQARPSSGDQTEVGHRGRDGRDVREPVVPGSANRPEPVVPGAAREPHRDSGSVSPTGGKDVPDNHGGRHHESRETGRENGGVHVTRNSDNGSPQTPGSVTVAKDSPTARELGHGGREPGREFSRESREGGREFGQRESQGGREGQFGQREGHQGREVARESQGREGQFGQGREGQVREGQGREVVREGQVREGQVREGQVREGQVREGQVRGEGHDGREVQTRDGREGQVGHEVRLSPDAQSAQASRDGQLAGRDGQSASIGRDGQLATTREGLLARDGQVTREGQVGAVHDGQNTGTQTTISRDGQTAGQTAVQGQNISLRDGQTAPTARDAQVSIAQDSAIKVDGQQHSTRDGQLGTTTRDGQITGQSATTVRDAQVTSTTARDAQVTSTTARDAQVTNATVRDIQTTAGKETQTTATTRDGQITNQTIADPTARTTSSTSTESGTRLASDKRCETATTESTTKAQTQQTSNEVITSQIIASKDRTAGSDTKSCDANLDTTNGCATSGPRINPILVNGSTDPNNPNGAQQPQTGLPTQPGQQVDPSQLQITLPGVQIVIDPTTQQVSIGVAVDPNATTSNASGTVQPPHIHATPNGVEIETTNGTWQYIPGAAVLNDGTVISPTGTVWQPLATGEYVQVNVQVENPTNPTPSYPVDYYTPYYVPYTYTYDEPYYPTTPTLSSIISSIANEIIDTVAPAVNISFAPVVEPIVPAMPFVTEIPIVNQIINDTISNQPLVQTILNTLDTVQNIINVESTPASTTTIQPSTDIIQQASQVIDAIQQITNVITSFEQIIQAADNTIAGTPSNNIFGNSDQELADFFNFGDQQPKSFINQQPNMIAEQQPFFGEQPNFGHHIDPRNFILDITENESFIQSQQPFSLSPNQQSLQPLQPQQDPIQPQDPINNNQTAPIQGHIEQDVEQDNPNNINDQLPESGIHPVDAVINDNQQQTQQTSENPQYDPYAPNNSGRIEASFISSDDKHTWDAWNADRSEMPYEREADEKQRIARERAEEDQRRAEEQARQARERAEAIRRQIEDQERRLRELLLADQATKKARILAQAEPRRKYIVKQGDTLESIATKELKDQNLSALIYQINKLSIRTQIVDGKRVVQLKAGMMILLPNAKDIAMYRAGFGKQQQQEQQPQQPAQHSSASKKGMRALLAAN